MKKWIILILWRNFFSHITYTNVDYARSKSEGSESSVFVFLNNRSLCLKELYSSFLKDPFVCYPITEHFSSFQFYRLTLADTLWPQYIFF